VRGWQEISHHLVFLLHNAGVNTAEKMADARRRAVLRASVEL
jgi:hypothetical protein